jgi:hypothetical protein
MTTRLYLIFATVFAIGIGHYYANTNAWQYTKLFGGLLNPPTPGRVHGKLPGELSFLTWIFHWSMVFDFLALLQYMWRWGDDECTGNKKWKLYAILHIPACLVNGVVMGNHLHRDKLILLKLLHPVLVFVGSIATCFGAYSIAHSNRWNSRLGHKKNDSVDGFARVLSNTNNGATPRRRDWDLRYTMESLAVGSVFAWGSLYLIV